MPKPQECHKSIYNNGLNGERNFRSKRNVEAVRLGFDRSRLSRHFGNRSPGSTHQIRKVLLPNRPVCSKMTDTDVYESRNLPAG